MRVGVDRHTGRVLTGWPHCRQSLEVIFTTALGTRCMRRDIDGLVPELQDRPGNQASIIRFAQAVADACRQYEPGFVPGKVVPVRLGPDGVAGFEVSGLFYEDGHLGIYGKPTAIKAGYAASGLLGPLAEGLAPT